MCHEESFQKFHAANPQVYAELVTLAREARQKGHQRVGIKMLWEVLRWYRLLRCSDGDYKLNNNYHAAYARMIMEREADLAGLFDVRGAHAVHLVVAA